MAPFAASAALMLWVCVAVRDETSETDETAQDLKPEHQMITKEVHKPVYETQTREVEVPHDVYHKAIVEEPHVQHVELVEVKADLETKDKQNVVAPCNEKKYVFDCPEGITCNFWDACPLKKDGSCPDGCNAYADALELSPSERMYKHVGEMKPSNCNKPCRFTDSRMLDEPAVFVASSAAVLKQKVAKLEERCTGMFAAIKLLSPSCRVRLRKVSSLTGFLMKALNRASEDVRGDGGDMTACEAVISNSVGQVIFDSISKLAKLFAQPSGQGHAARVIQQWGKDLSSGFCAAQVASKSTSCINRDSGLASEICSSLEVSEAAGIENIIESQGGDETIGTNKIDKIDEAMKVVEETLDEPSIPGSSDSLIQMGLMNVSLGDIFLWLIFCGIFGTIFGLLYTGACLLTTPLIGSKPNFDGNWFGSCTSAHWCYFWGVGGQGDCARAAGFVYSRGWGKGTPMRI